MQKNNYMDIMEKNHMEIPWHDYTENDSNVLILWNRSMACPHFHEPSCKGTWCHLHRGCRTYVHRI